MPEEEIVRTTSSGDAAGAAIGASSLIRSIVWAIVVLVLLGVALYLLHVYLGLF